MKLSKQRLFDSVAIGASGLCLLHCLVLPFVIAMLPLTVALAASSEWVHFWILVTAIPTSLLALISGARRSGKRWALIGGCASLFLLFLGYVLEDLAWLSTAL
ncbi:MAG: MerC domain-containing protein, partial [Shewanella sp.]